MPSRRRWIIWAVYLTLFTGILTYPTPDPILRPTEDFLPTGRRQLVAKFVHVAGFAVLAILTGWLRAPQRWRPALMFFVMALGAATELIQLCFAQRNGSLFDVGWDNLGVLIGFALSWKWWAEP